MFIGILSLGKSCLRPDISQYSLVALALPDFPPFLFVCCNYPPSLSHLASVSYITSHHHTSSSSIRLAASCCCCCRKHRLFLLLPYAYAWLLLAPFPPPFLTPSRVISLSDCIAFATSPLCHNHGTDTSCGYLMELAMPNSG